MTSMDASARAWLVTVAKDHFWRVPSWYDFDDLLAEGFEMWAWVVKQYETDTGRVRNRAHLMRLFKTAYLRRIHTLSKRATKARNEVRAGDIGLSIEDMWDCTPHNLGEYEMMVADAPAILKPILRALLLEVPAPNLRALYRVNRDGTRATLNDRLCKMAGFNSQQIDLADELRAFLTSR